MLRDTVVPELPTGSDLFKAVSQAAYDGVVVLDDSGRVVFWNEAATRILGYPAKEVLGQKLHELIAPERYLDAVRSGWHEFVNSGRGRAVGTTLELNALTNKNVELPIELSVSATQLKGHWYAIGIMRDLTEQKHSEAALKGSRNLLSEIVENIPIRVFWKDLDSNYLGCNSLFAQDAGMASPNDVVGKSDDQLPWRGQAEQYRADDRRVMGSGTAELGYEEPQTTPKGQRAWLRMSKVPLKDFKGTVYGLLGVYEDVTELRNSQMALERSLRAQRAFGASNSVLVRASDEDELLRDMCHAVVHEAGYRLAWFGYVAHDKAKSIVPAASSGYEKGYLEKIKISWADNEFGHGPSGTAVREGKFQVIRDIQSDQRMAPWRKEALQRGYASSIALPIKKSNGDVFGALNIYASESDAFDDAEINLLREMADNLAFGIESLRNRSTAIHRERQVLALTNHNPDGLLIVGDKGVIEFVNPAAERLLGYSAEQLNGRKIKDFLPHHEGAEIELYRRDIPQGEESVRFAQFKSVHLKSPQGDQTLVFLHEITEQKRAQKLSQRMGKILERSWDEIYVFAADTLRFVDVSAGAMAHLGYSLHELRQMSPIDIKPEFSVEKFEELVEPLRNGSQHEIQFESLQRRKDGAVYPVEIRLQLSQEEQPPVFIAISQDITERKNYIAELEHKALYDELTDLPNRALLQDRLGHAIKLSRRDQATLAVVIMNLLQLGDINDLMGYQHGDKVQQEVAHRLLGLCRESDTVSRLSEGVFALLLPRASLESTKLVVRKIMSSLEPPVTINGVSLEIEAAFGVAIYPDHGDDSDTLLQRSDIAMRLAKQDGLGMSVYTDRDDPLKVQRLKLHGQLRKAIEKRELAIFYQPQMDLETGKVVGAEALARWPHAEEGMIPPSDFIPMVEQTGLIQPFTHWVLEESISMLRYWSEKGVDLKISVNISTRNLLDPDLVGSIRSMLQEQHVDPRNLVLEITESSLMSRPEQALKILGQFREIGIEISIDDFGTGYSSLAYLKKLPVSELKIDQSFVFGLIKSEDDKIIVRSTIELAHNLGLRTVAEGIEDEETLNMLRAFNCDTIQGFYLSPPLPKEEFVVFLQGEGAS